MGGIVGGWRSLEGFKAGSKSDRDPTVEAFDRLEGRDSVVEAFLFVVEISSGRCAFAFLEDGGFGTVGIFLPKDGLHGSWF